MKTNAQTVIISPTGDGGFENGATFAANGWTANTPAATNKNQWFCGTNATAGFTGTNSAYITNDASLALPPHQYTRTLTCFSHLYRDVTIPATESTIQLDFSWIGAGHATNGRMRIWIMTTATAVPVNGTQITAVAGSVEQVGLANYSLQGSWTNAATVAIPAAYAGTTFRLVFEWGNINSTATQPPAAIDNISLVSSTPAACIAPAAANTFLSGTKTTTTFPATFSGSANGYLVIRSTSSTPPSQPVNGTVYTAANIATLGSGLTFIQSSASTSITSTGLTGNTLYYYYIFAYNNIACSAGPAYNTSGPLTGSGATCPDVPTTVSTGSVSANGFSINWAAPTGGSAAAITYTVQVTTDAGFSNNVTGSPFTVLAPTVTQSVTGLNSNTPYYYRVLASNGCSSTYVTGNQTTALPACAAPTAPTPFVLGTVTTTSVPATFSGSANGYLVVRSLSSTPPSQPVNGTTYSTANIATLGAAFTFIQSSNATSIAGTGLASSTTYYYFIYAYNTTSCTGGPVYNTAGPLTGNGTTLNAFNDDCATAFALTINSGTTCTTSTSGTTVGATQSLTGCAGTADDDVWYKFVPTAVSHTITVTPGTLTDAVMQIYNGACGTLGSLGCVDTTGGSNPETVILTGLTIGNTYFVRVYSYGSPAKGTFTICVTTQPVPVNATCSSATTLPCATSNLAGTTVGSPSTAHGSGCVMSNRGVWYKFTGDGNMTTISSTATSGWDHAMSVSSGSCGSLTSIACRDNAGTDGTETYTFTTVNGTNYFVYISHYDSTSTTTGAFVISRTCTPPPPPLTNDNCSGAIALTVNSSCSYSYYTNAGATASSGVPAPGCASYSGGDVWFSVVVPANGILYFDSIAGGMTDGGMALYTGSCGSLSLLTCNDSSSANPGDMPFISRTGLTPGQTIFIRFWEYGNDNNGTFGICVTSPAACTIGNGNGTSNLACLSVVSGGLNLLGSDPTPINACSSTTCADLEVDYTRLKETTSYTVSSISYSPTPYQYGCLQNHVSVNIDDVWSPVVSLPFNFCFYGNNYNQCLISSNGVLTFDLTNNTPGGTSAWSFTNTLPSTNLFRNSIFGVFQDIDPSKGGEVGWELVTINSGCRALVVSWSDIPMYSCNSSRFTGMMVLYENTNIIEVYIDQKQICSSWNGGNAIVGIQNANATLFTAPPARNSVTTDWTASHEAWRFTPSGTSITPTIKWYQGSGTSGPIVGTNPTLNVCPTVTTIYTAEATFNFCNGVHKITDQTTVSVGGSKTWDGSTDTDWNKNDNWTPDGIPNGADCVTIPITANNPIVSGTGYNGLAGTLKVMTGATLTVNANNSVTVTDAVTVQPGGTFQILDDASLVQINSVTNTGDIKYYRDTSIRKLDYVYWSSPVVGFNVNNISSPIAPGPIYTWNTTYFPNPNGGYGIWESAAGTTMQRGIGYIVRAPVTFDPATPATLHGLFTGVPNNGTIPVTVTRGNDQNTLNHYGTNGTQITNYSDNFNLLGNPYPSALRGSQFLFDNKAVIDGNIKLWTHGTLPAMIQSPFYNTFLYNYTSGDYLTFNFTGTSCCPAAGSDLYIGAAQGFFVQMIDGPPTSGVVYFNNNQRSATLNNSVFYRPANHHTENDEAEMANVENLERNRIWLDIIDGSNQSSDRTLIGYVEGATNEKDLFYDANTVVSNAMTLYSLIGDTERFIIQGRTLPFDENDTVPLGARIPADGNYKIGLAALDGLFKDVTQKIYIEDRTLGIIHDLRQEPYSFTANTGTYDTRFLLRYTDDGSLGVNQNDAQDISVYIHDQELLASASQNISIIEVFDISGKLVKTYVPKEKSHTFNGDFVYARGVYFAKIKLENGFLLTKKLMN